MLASLHRHFTAVTQNLRRRTNSTTPVVEVATIEVQPPPGTTQGNTVFIEAFTDDDHVNENDGRERKRERGRYTWSEITENYILLIYYIAYNLAISLNSPNNAEIGSCAKMVSFWTIAVFSMLDALADIKFFYMINPARYVISLGYNLNVFLVRSSWTYVSFKRRSEIKELLEVLRKGKECFPNSHHKQMVCKSIGIMLGISFLECIVRLIKYDLAWKDWTLGEVVGSRAYDICHTTMVWNGEEANSTEIFIESFTENINFISAPLALLSLVMQTGALSHAHICMAILLAIALYVREMVLEFCAELRKSSSTVDGKIAEKVWRMYLYLKDFSDMCNEIYAPSISILQVESFMLGAFFVNHCLEFRRHASIIIFLLCIMMKHAVFYFCLAVASSANDAFRAWILKNFSDKTMIEIENGPRLTFQALMEELNSKPIGIKSNSSLINTAFIAQLVGGSVHIFFLLLDRLEK